MRDSYNIEALPEAVRSGEMTAAEGAKIIWEDIYTNPMRYGLIRLTEDQKSDLLLESRGLFERLFEKFVPGQVTFQTYISSCIMRQKKHFLKVQLAKENERRSMASLLRTKNEEDSQKYLPHESCGSMERVSRSKNTRNFSDIIGGGGSRDKRIAELTALILALKACKDVDDETVSAVSDFTKIDKSLLYDEIQNLKDSMARRDENHQKLIRKRNNAFFFHRKYMQEMLSPNITKERMRLLQKKYEEQTRKWEKNNEALSRRSNTPSNQEIARRIGMRPRTVSFYISHVRNTENLARIRNIYMKDSDNEKPADENKPAHDGQKKFNGLEQDDSV